MSGKKKPGRLRAPERFTVEAVADLLETASVRLAEGKRLRIDLSAVVNVDSAAMQCLVVLRRAAGERGSELRLDGAPAPVVDAARLLGLDALLGLA